MKKISKSKVISIYALSLYQAAEETAKLEKVSAEAAVLRTLIAEQPEIVADLSAQLVPLDDKKEIIAAVSKKLKFGKEMTACLNILAENGRLAELPGVLDEFRHIYYRRHNVEEVEVQTVKALSAAQDKKLKALLEKKLAKKVLLTYTIKPDLLGGLVIKYGSSMIDDSVSGKLTRLEIIMKGGQ